MQTHPVERLKDTSGWSWLIAGVVVLGLIIVAIVALSARSTHLRAQHESHMREALLRPTPASAPPAWREGVWIPSSAGGGPARPTYVITQGQAQDAGVVNTQLPAETTPR